MEEYYNLSTKNKGADQPHGYLIVDFAYAISRFSHDAAHVVSVSFRTAGPGQTLDPDQTALGLPCLPSHLQKFDHIKRI